MKENEFKGWFDRGLLPHCDYPGLTQFITFRLGDSLPKKVCEKLLNGNSSYSEKLGKILDNGVGACLLRDQSNAEIVMQVLLCRDGSDYKLHAWCIMPNHVHVLISPKIPLDKIVKAWKSVSCRMIKNSGENLWYSDYFDRYIRNEAHFSSTKYYIEMNPVRANLCKHPEDWIYSSAHDRHIKRVDTSDFARG